jgi:hypothetical protein
LKLEVLSLRSMARESDSLPRHYSAEELLTVPVDEIRVTLRDEERALAE